MRSIECWFQARASSTIEKNVKNLNVNKFDLEFEVTPAQAALNTD